MTPTAYAECSILLILLAVYAGGFAYQHFQDKRAEARIRKEEAAKAMVQSFNWVDAFEDAADRKGRQ